MPQVIYQHILISLNRALYLRYICQTLCDSKKHNGKPCNLQGKTPISQGTFDNKRLWQYMHQMWERSFKLKAPEGKQHSFKSVALAVIKHQHKTTKDLTKESNEKYCKSRVQNWWRPSGVWEATVEHPRHGKVSWQSTINSDKHAT